MYKAIRNSSQESNDISFYSCSESKALKLHLCNFINSKENSVNISLE